MLQHVVNLSNNWNRFSIEYFDCYADIRREMTKLSDFFRHHVLSGARTFTIQRDSLPNFNSNDASGTKSLIASLRTNLEQYLQVRIIHWHHSLIY